MNEINRILSLFEKGYQGSPWIDVNLVDTLQAITAEQALKKIKKNSNSIWEITNHLISWRKSVLQRMQGMEVKAPSHNYFVQVETGSAAEWKKTLDELAVTQTAWIQFLKGFHESSFEKMYVPNQLTYYEHIHGILQHDAYHLGQIVMLKKLLD